MIRTTHYKRRLWAGISRVYVDSCRSWLYPVAMRCQASTFALATTKKIDHREKLCQNAVTQWLCHE